MKTIEEMLNEYTECVKKRFALLDEDKYAEAEEVHQHQYALFDSICNSKEFKKKDKRIRLLYIIGDVYEYSTEFVEDGVRLMNIDGDFDYTYPTMEEALIDWLPYLETSNEEGNLDWEEEIEYIKSLMQ